MAEPLAASVTGGREASSRVRDVMRARRGLRAREQPHRAADLRDEGGGLDADHPSAQVGVVALNSFVRAPVYCYRESLRQNTGLCLTDFSVGG